MYLVENRTRIPIAKVAYFQNGKLTYQFKKKNVYYNVIKTAWRYIEHILWYIEYLLWYMCQT